MRPPVRLQREPPTASPGCDLPAWFLTYSISRLSRRLRTPGHTYGSQGRKERHRERETERRKEGKRSGGKEGEERWRRKRTGDYLL